MKQSAFRRQAAEPQVGAADSDGWAFGTADIGITCALFAAAVAICLPLALHFRQESHDWEARAQESTERTVSVRASILHLENRRVALSQFRRELTRYVKEAENKPIVPWTTAVSEISRHRPRGLWTVRLSGNGPHFRAQVAAERADLVTEYAQSLRQSPYMDFAALPAGAAPASRSQLVGRLVGE